MEYCPRCNAKWDVGNGYKYCKHCKVTYYKNNSLYLRLSEFPYRLIYWDLLQDKVEYIAGIRPQRHFPINKIPFTISLKRIEKLLLFI